MTLIIWIAVFLSCALVIFIAATRLSRYADIIADKTGMSQAWIGFILMPLATSMPEFVTSISAGSMGAPDLAVGNVFGSNIFNITVIAIIDLLHRPAPILLKVGRRNVLIAGLGIVLAAIASIFILVAHITDRLSLNIGGIGWDTLVIAIAYVACARVMFTYEKKNVLTTSTDRAQSAYHAQQPFSRVISGFAICAMLILVASIYLAKSGDNIARLTSLGGTFVGTIFVAITTSFPELFASLAAVRLGAYELAIATLFGANVFNMLIPFFIDVAYRDAPLFSAISMSHAITALMSMILVSLAGIGLMFRSKRTIFGIMGVDAFLILIAYISSVYLLFILGVEF